MNIKSNTIAAKTDAAQTKAIDGLLAISNVYLESAGRLSELTLSAARESLEGCVAASRDTSAGGAGAIQAVFGQPAIERAMAYARTSFEILSHAQQEAVQILGQQFPVGQIFPLAGDSKAGIDFFTRGFRQLTSIVSDGVAAAADTGARMSTELERQVKKVA